MKYLLMAGIAMFVSVGVLGQDAEYMKLRSTIEPAGRDTATENGFRAVYYAGLHASSLFSFNAWGSTGVFQVEATYWGSLHFRNKRDNVNWTDWKTIYHTGNFKPGDYMPALVNAWNKDVTGRERFFFGAFDNNTGSTTYFKGYGAIPFQLINGSDVPILQLAQNGDMGIGTTTTHGHKLAVAGSILAEKIKIKQVPNWPDFVFHKDYPLPSLQELEAFIQRHRHLPEIPSEQEVAETGVDLGEMNRKLLQKVEELTLYIIAQDKQMKAMEQRVKTLENQSR